MQAPVWIPADFRHWFLNHVWRPLNTPEQYHDTLLPLPWKLVVYSRDNVRAAIEELSKEHHLNGIFYITVTAGKTTTAMLEFDALIRSIGERASESPQAMIVIENADILCMEPDNESQILLSLDLGRAKSCGALVLAISSRLPTHIDSSRLTPWAVSCCKTFFRQFDIAGYMEVPDADFRIRLLKWATCAFQLHMTKSNARANLQLTIQDDEYEKLSDCTSYASTKQIWQWLRQVAFPYIHSKESIVTIDYETLETQIPAQSNVGGFRHISSMDTKAAESEFRMAAGLGPLVTDPTPTPMVAPIKLATEEGAFKSARKKPKF